MGCGVRGGPAAGVWRAEDGLGLRTGTGMWNEKGTGMRRKTRMRREAGRGGGGTRDAASGGWRGEAATDGWMCAPEPRASAVLSRAGVWRGEGYGVAHPECACVVVWRRSSAITHCQLAPRLQDYTPRHARRQLHRVLLLPEASFFTARVLGVCARCLHSTPSAPRNVAALPRISRGGRAWIRCSWRLHLVLLPARSSMEEQTHWMK
ncbi:hypothetical protein DFH08DRAFT_151146 [Mycena albidolilacea]|uniref:Uncharacterized protein n=1 Tax=Mycena albidolilacea TaxID=1033008 RepID=A0AAD7ETV4_9AGAR|nr:hypothetical protein DFH08DRAFT_151146 [Mycena albidolilacea]